MGIFFDNPIAAMQFQVRGGWKTFLVLVGGFGFLIVCGIVCTLTFSLSPPAVTMRGWSFALLGAQTVIVLLVGQLRISAAIRQDRLINTIESHRLMPIDGRVSLAGYVLGAGQPFLGLYLITLLIGCVTTGVSGLDIQRWLMSNLILLSFIVFVWILAAVAAMVDNLLNALLVIAVFMLILSQGMLLYAVPAVMILCTPMMGDTIYRLSSVSAVGGLGIGLLAQLAILVVMVILAQRKFRRPEGRALSLPLALLLLAVWVVISLLGAWKWDSFAWSGLAQNFSRSQNSRLLMQFIGSILSSLIFVSVCLSIIPKVRPLSWGRQIVTRWCTVILLVLFLLPLLVIPLCDPPILTPHALEAASLSLAIMVIDIACVMGLFSPTAASRGVSSFLILAVLWLAPLIIDGVTATNDEKHWTVGMISPIATFQSPWIVDQPLWKGLGSQLVVAGALFGMAGLTSWRRWRRKSAGADVSLSIAMQTTVTS